MAEVRSASRHSWRAWRQTRPFWGGLLLVLAGIELIGIPLSGVLGHGAVRLVIYIGIGGVFGVLIGALLVACGVAVWVNAGHRQFYGIAGVLLGILSFPASNLGGFFIGMLLAIVGGSIAFAWAPAEPAEQPSVSVPGQPGHDGPGPLPGDLADAGPERSGLTDLGLADTDPGDVGPGETGPRDAGPADGFPPAGTAVSWGRGQRMLAVAAMPLVLLAVALGAPGARAAAAAPAGPSGTCILGILCLPSPSPSSSPSPSPSPGQSTGPSSTGPAAPTSSSGTTPPTGRSKGKRSARRRASAGSGLVAATATSVIKAGSATLDDLAYQGAASVRVGHGGTVRMMKFTASSVTLAGGVTASVTQGGTGGEPGATTVTTSPSLAFSGSVVLYATQLSGCLGPLCVTLTPGNAVAVLLRLASGVTGELTLTLTHVVTDQPLVTARALQAGALRISFG